MELIQMPKELQNRGFTGWPQVYRVSKHEQSPPVGVPYIIAEQVDFALVFRVMVPMLQKQHPYFNWKKVYENVTGKEFSNQRVYYEGDPIEFDGYSYYASGTGECDVTLEELAADENSYVDLDVLAKMGMLPKFLDDIREAIKVNVTNSYMWNDGYNKKTGICSGFLVEQPRPRSLIILDISSSIPDGVSAGMMTLIKTITEIVSADLIITASRSYFYTLEEVRQLDIDEVRREIPRGNESLMFREILDTHDMDYDNVIAFGDTDNPGTIKLNQKINTKRFYSFFVGGSYDTYGHWSKKGAGYGRWVLENNPSAVMISDTTWAKFFNRRW